MIGTVYVPSSVIETGAAAWETSQRTTLPRTSV